MYTCHQHAIQAAISMQSGELGLRDAGAERHHVHHSAGVGGVLDAHHAVEELALVRVGEGGGGRAAEELEVEAQRVVLRAALLRVEAVQSAQG